MAGRLREKLKREDGIGLAEAMLLVLILGILLLFLRDGYIRHVQEIRLTFDREQVDEAVSLAQRQYLTEGRSGPVTYYYDAERKCLTGKDGSARIRGYGRSLAAQNRRGETGASGVPNKGKDGGPQFLVISLKADGAEPSARWQGPVPDYQDYLLMTKEERDGLTEEEFLHIREEAPEEVQLIRSTPY